MKLAGARMGAGRRVTELGTYVIYVSPTVQEMIFVMGPSLHARNTMSCCLRTRPGHGTIPAELMPCKIVQKEPIACKHVSGRLLGIWLACYGPPFNEPTGPISVCYLLKRKGRGVRAPGFGAGPLTPGARGCDGRRRSCAPAQKMFDELAGLLI